MSSKFIFFVTFLLFFNLAAQKKSLNWTIKHDTWSESDEKRFQTFVYEIGMGKEKRQCHNIGQCLSNKNVNKRYLQLTPNNLHIKGFHSRSGGHVGDCSFAPYILRAYFAWMNDLPFAFPTRAKVNPGNKHKEIRLNTYGGTLTQWHSVKSGDNFNNVLAEARSIYTVVYRVSADTESSITGTAGNKNYIASPFYSAKLSNESIVPGTILYSANKGHVLMVYKVTEEGDIWFIDGHPDNSLSRKRFGDSMFYPRPIYLGAGFMNWRNYRINDYSVDGNGVIQGGYYSAMENNEHGEMFSLEQFNYKKINNKSYEIEGKDYFDYVQSNVGVANIEINLLSKFSERMDELCESLTERHRTVVDAITHKVHKKSHPDRLPKNIYATDDWEWETYSTPSRDMAFKGNIISNLSYFKRLVKRYKNADPKIIYEGNQLKDDLQSIYSKKSQCKITYNNSFGEPVDVNLDQSISRLFKISFDPYHCIELRWGASNDELSSCQDNSTKQLWYKAEQRLRNVVSGGHEIEISMSKNVKQLLQDKSLGDDDLDPLEYNIQSFLDSL